jgi:glycosyltransferase involved in cell wall biosynthesis
MPQIEPTLPLPLVSIVINSFNQAAYLEQTIQSVFNQEYPNLEVILVDGGSTDGSLEIIKKYADRFRWWVSEPDRGQADGINKGLSQARGELVAWLNSDDLYEPGAVADAVRVWQQNRSASLIYGDVLAIDLNGKPFNRIACGAYQLPELLSFHIINQPAVFINRSVLKVAGALNTSYHYLLDHQLWIRCAAEGDTVYVRRVWARGRFHAGAKNVAAAANFGEEALRIAEWSLKDKRVSEMALALRSQVRAGAERMNARYLMDAGKYSQAWDSYRRGLFFSPGVILPEIHRMLFCLLGMIGLGSLKNVFNRLRGRPSA